jgi:hypothetical protein
MAIACVCFFFASTQMLISSCVKALLHLSVSMSYNHLIRREQLFSNAGYQFLIG